MNDSLLKKVYFILKEIGIDFNKISEEFNTRKSLQKKLYLLQALGINFGYRYNLYLHGPYSPALTEDAYTIENYLDSLEKETYGWKLNVSGYELLNRANNIINESKKFALDATEWLELLTTLHYLYKEVYYEKAEKKLIIINRFKELKSQFRYNDNEINRAWQIITNEM